MIQHYGNGLRNQWEFSYTARQLAHGAQKQKEFRLARHAVWDSKFNEVMAEIRAKGLLVNEGAMDSMLATMAVGSTYAKGQAGGHAPVVAIDKRLQEKLSESYAKKEEHKAFAEQYETWIQTLSAQPDEVLKVTHEDYKFFFLNVRSIPGSQAAPIATMGNIFVVDPPVESPPGPTLQGTLREMTVPSLKPVSGQAGSSASPFQPFVAPPMLTPVAPPTVAQGVIHPVAPNASGVFVPPDLDTPSAEASIFDDWPTDE